MAILRDSNLWAAEVLGDMPQGNHPLKTLPENIGHLDRYMEKLKTRETELATNQH